MTIGITGASGPLGRTTTELVLQHVDPNDVVLISRTPAELADLAARGAQVRRADFDDPGSLVDAFEGVDRLLLVSTDKVGARLDQHRAAIAAATKAGVAHTVYTSIPKPLPGNPALVVRDHAGTEQALRHSGLRWTMLRNNLYAHLQLGGVENAVATGRLITNHGPGAAAYVTREDCAAVAAAVLTQDGHEGQVLDVTGPAAITARELAALAHELGDRDVEIVEVDDHTFAGTLRAAGLNEPAAELVTSFGAATRGGYLDYVSDAVTRLTGRIPTPFAEVARRALGAR